MSANPTDEPVDASVDDPAAPVGHQAVFIQAPVPPLDASGFTASIVGTVLAALAWVASQQWHFPETWSDILFTATALGLGLIGYTAWHRNHITKQAAKPAAGPDGS